MAATPATHAPYGGKPQSNHDTGEAIITYSGREIKLLHDPTVKLEEYMFYAALSRESEQRLYGANRGWVRPGWPSYGQDANISASVALIEGAGHIRTPLSSDNESEKEQVRDERSSSLLVEAEEKDEGVAADTEVMQDEHSSTEEKDKEKRKDEGDATHTEDMNERKETNNTTALDCGHKSDRPQTYSAAEGKYLGVDDSEWAMASRAARTASWGTVFYLITTDIIGPQSVPWVLSQMGWGPGTVLYLLFGVLAFYGGFQLWQMFMVLDSDRFPIKTFGDLAYRIMGKHARHTVNILLSIQLFFNVGILILSDGQAIFQISQGPHAKKGLCFVVCNLIFAAAGCFLGQIRTLRQFGWIAHAAIWLNIVVMVITMAVCAHTAPNYVAANAQNLIPLVDPPEPVYHYVGVNPTIGFSGQLVGLMQAIYSYGGSMLFCEFMSEMRKPWDFFKAQLCAEAFMFFCYIFYGCFVYAYQGQYTIQIAYDGLSPYSWQTVTNAISLVFALIAACLYGNIGIKVFYEAILRELFHFPSLETTTGKTVWIALVPLYWAAAYVICSAIPNVTNFSGLVAALCILQFSYTFPPILMLALDCQRDAMLPEETFNPVTGEVHRVDSGWDRIKRGFFARRVPLKLWYILFALGSLVVAILGAYSSIRGLVNAFKHNSNVTSFECKAPI